MPLELADESLVLPDHVILGEELRPARQEGPLPETIRVWVNTVLLDDLS